MFNLKPTKDIEIFTKIGRSITKYAQQNVNILKILSISSFKYIILYSISSFNDIHRFKLSFNCDKNYVSL